MPKVYLTNKALTKGIVEKVTDIKNSRFGDKYIVDNYNTIYLDKDVFLTKEKAIKDAEKKRDKKIESLKKQIDKLEHMDFR